MSDTSAMERCLEFLLDDSDRMDPKYGPVCEVQIEFKGFGITTPQGDPNMTAGILRKTEIEGIFCIGSAAPATMDMPGGIRKGEVVVIEMFFEPESVRRVIRAKPRSGIVTPGHA